MNDDAGVTDNNYALLVEAPCVIAVVQLHQHCQNHQSIIFFLAALLAKQCSDGLHGPLVALHRT